MCKFLLLFLGVAVLNEADGTLASVSPDELDEFSSFEDGKEPQVTYHHFSEDPYGYDSALKKRSDSDKLMRRSSLDKNFMRNGGGITVLKRISNESVKPVVRRAEDNFIRFGRSQSDGFMRFGRDDGFMRFGRGDGRDNFMRFGRGDGKDNFMRFGRGDAKDNFMRFGRGDGKDNFMRFGRGDGKDNFMRFGRGDSGDTFARFETTDKDYGEDIFRPGYAEENSFRNDNFMKFGKNVKSDVNFLRFGKSGGKDDGFIRFGRNGTNFLRFGRDLDAEGAAKTEESYDTNLVNPDANEDGLKSGPLARRKRAVSDSYSEGTRGESRNPKMVDEIPPSSEKSSLVEENVIKPNLLKFISLINSNHPMTSGSIFEPDRFARYSVLDKHKRKQDKSSFIRFG